VFAWYFGRPLSTRLGQLLVSFFQAATTAVECIVYRGPEVLCWLADSFTTAYNSVGFLSLSLSLKFKPFQGSESPPLQVPLERKRESYWCQVGWLPTENDLHKNVKDFLKILGVIINYL
jgi:hypothetical protein